MKKYFSAFVALALGSTGAANAITATQAQIPFSIYTIDIRAINDNSPATNMLAIYDGFNNGTSQWYVLSPVTVTTPYSNSAPPKPITATPSFCLQTNAECPNICDITQMATNAMSSNYEQRNLNYTTAGLSTIINNFPQNMGTNLFNCYVLNQTYVTTLVKNPAVSVLELSVGLESDGKTLQFIYTGLNNLGSAVPGTVMVDTAPLAYTGATVR
jgi:hypothetical protein